MGDKTKIGWTIRVVPPGVDPRYPEGLILDGKTFNAWIGCLKVAPECAHCYAETQAIHWKWNLWGPASSKPEFHTPRRVTSDAYWRQPAKWQKEAVTLGHRPSVFCASLADIFEDHPDIVEARARLWEVIGECPDLNWLLLTKRPENTNWFAPKEWFRRGWPDNVWAGSSFGSQGRANSHMRYLLEVPASVRFVSYEPAIEDVDFTPWIAELDWIICGGESGTGITPFNLDWGRHCRDQCLEAGIPFFFKQVGGRYHDVGGRLLDGRTWDEMPPEINNNRLRVV